MLLAKQSILMGLACVAVVANAKVVSPPSPACEYCMGGARKTVSPCANESTSNPLTFDDPFTQTPEQLACACALATSMDWINACTNFCEEDLLAYFREGLANSTRLFCKGSTATLTGSTPTTNPNDTRGSSASTTMVSLMGSAALVLLAAAHTFF